MYFYYYNHPPPFCQPNGPCGQWGQVLLSTFTDGTWYVERKLENICHGRNLLRNVKIYA